MDKQENQNITPGPEQPQEPYKERPRYQVWAARIGLVVMIICVALYLWHIASGGMQ